MNIINWIKGFWGALPLHFRAVTTGFFGGVFTLMMAHAMQGKTCLTWACVHDRIPEFLAAGATAAWAYYQNPAKKPMDPPPIPPA